MNVSSVIVRAAKEKIESVINNINAVDFCEVHFFDSGGKIVATIEGESINDQMERMKKIQKMPDVLSVNLSYSYCEDEIAGAIGDMKKHP
jgi:nitrate reductase NapD